MIKGIYVLVIVTYPVVIVMQRLYADCKRLALLESVLGTILHENSISRWCSESRDDAHGVRYYVETRCLLGERTYDETGAVLEIPVFPYHLTKLRIR